MAAVQRQNCRPQWEWARDQEATVGIPGSDDVVCPGVLEIDRRNSEYVLRWRKQNLPID